MARPKKTANAKGDSEWIRERLLDAAEHLFARKGYEATGLREIGARVGVTNATLLHHFGSKLALYRAVLVRLALALRALIDSVVDDDGEPVRALHRFIDRFVAWNRENRNYGFIAFREFMDKTVHETHLDVRLEADVLRRLAELVRSGQRRRVFRDDVDVEAFVAQLLGTIWLADIATDTVAMIFERDATEFGAQFQGQSVAALIRSVEVPEPAAVPTTRPQGTNVYH